MFELLFTSFPVIIRYYQLKRRGEAMSVWNMRSAVLLWAGLAIALFLTIFYFHPKSYSGLLPFRTVSVVAQTAGPVTEVAVTNGQRIEAGDVLFRIEDSSQRAALSQAQATLAQVDAAETQAQDNLVVAQTGVAEVEAQLANTQVDLDNATQLFEREIGPESAVRDLQTQVTALKASLEAARAQVDLAQSVLDEGIEAERATAAAALEGAQAALDKTVVHSYTGGVVTQLVLSEGSPASTLILSPAMVIIPDRPANRPLRITAGFSQVARATIYEGMPAEIACDSNINLGFRDAIFPAYVSSIQPAVAAGQVVPSGQLREPSNAVARGSMLVFFELIHPEHIALMLDGSGCIVQTYTANLHGVFGHVIGATGIVKAAGLRLKVWGALISGVGLAGGGGH